jgi:hypothetical protein
MKKELEDYDWESAFGENGNIWPFPPNLAPGFKGSDAEWTRKDVSRIIALSPGDNDGPDWLICGRLKDGRFFSLAAGCDYTGWDCQAGGSAVVAGSEDDILRFGLTESEAERLGLKKKRAKVIAQAGAEPETIAATATEKIREEA